MITQQQLRQLLWKGGQVLLVAMGDLDKGKRDLTCFPGEKYSDAVQRSSLTDVYVFIRYLREEHDELCQLLVGLVGLQLEYLNIGLVVSVLLQKLWGEKKRATWRDSQGRQVLLWLNTLAKLAENTYLIPVGLRVPFNEIL